MKERPILFNGAQVRALIDGRKTQTRRAVKPQPELSERVGFVWKGYAYGLGSDNRGTQRNFARPNCPYGQPGDRLWVRETFAYSGEEGTNDGAPNDVWRPANPSFLPDIHRCWYRATDGHTADGFWKPSIHMPRWASRITLEIVSVRVERLQEISEADAQKEGAELMDCSGFTDSDISLLDLPVTEPSNPHRNGFALLWESINGAGSWDANPWVWVVEFKRLESGHA